MAKNPYEGLAVPVEDDNPYAGLAVPVDDAQQPQMGFFEHLGKAGQFGAAVAAANYGKTLKQVPENSYTGNKAAELGQALENAGQSALPQGYQPSNFTVGDLFNKNKTWGDIGSSLGWKLAESAPGLATSGAIGALTGGTGFVGSEIAQHYGENAEARQAANGGKPLTGKDAAIVGATTGAEALLSRFGLGKAASGLTSTGVPSILGTAGRALANTGEAAFDNAGVGALSDVVNQEGRSAFNDKNSFLINPDTTEVLNAAAQGGTAGAALRGARVPGDITQDVRFGRTFGSNPEVAKGLANDILNSPVQPTTGAKAFQNLNLVDAGIKRDIASSQAASADHFAQNPQAADLVASAKDQLAQGIPLHPEQLSALNTHLGSTEAPGQLNFNLQKANQLLKLKQMGNWDAEGKTFTGGAADSTYGKMTNPLGVIQGILAKGAHGNIGALGALTAAAEMSGHGIIGHLPAIVGSMLAARTGLHALDYMTGFKNPTQNFANRFAGEGGNAPSITPPQPPPPTPENQWASYGPAMRDDAAFNKANDANMPQPTVGQLAQQAAMKQKAMEIAQAQAQAQAAAPGKAMQAWMAAKGNPNNLPEAQGFQADQAFTPREQQAQGFQGFMPKGGSVGIPEAQGFSAAPPAPPEVQGQGVLSKAALTQIAMNKLNAQKAAALAKTTQAWMNKKGPVNLPEAQGFETSTATQPWATPQVSELAQQPQPVDPKAAAQAQANYDKLIAARQPDFGASKTAQALKALQKLSGKPEKANGAAPATSVAPDAPQAPKVNGEAPGASQETPKDTSVPTISVTYRGHTVTRPQEGIKNEYAYKAGIQKNIAPRADLADDLKASLGKSQVGNVNHLIDLMNNHSSEGLVQAEEHLINFVNDSVPAAARGLAMDIIDKHMPAIRRSFGH